MFQINILDDTSCTEKAQWDAAIKFMEDCIKEKLKTSQYHICLFYFAFTLYHHTLHFVFSLLYFYYNFNCHYLSCCVDVTFKEKLFAILIGSDPKKLKKETFLWTFGFPFYINTFISPSISMTVSIQYVFLNYIKKI